MITKKRPMYIETLCIIGYLYKYTYLILKNYKRPLDVFWKTKIN